MIYSGSDRVPKELWMEVHNIVQEVVIKTIPKKKKCKKVLASAAHILKLERYREDQHGPCAKMTRKFVKRSIFKKKEKKKKKCKKAKWLSEEALQIAEKRGEAKSKGEKEKQT